jgi:hypothetical protein
MESANADDLLATYLAESNDPAAERILHILIGEIAAPYVLMVVSSNLRGPQQTNSADASQEVLLDLTSRLRRLREEPARRQTGDEPLIRNFRAYMASAARRAAGYVLRRSNPERYRLRNRIRYSLKTGDKFTLTEDDLGRRIAGLRRFLASASVVAEDWLRSQPVPAGAASMPLPALIDAVLTALNAPVLLDHLTDYLGAASGGFARQAEFESAAAVPVSNLADQMDQRAWLAHLWTEIVELPRNQRMALLLNLRDHLGDSALRFLPATGIASIRQLAVTLEMQPEALAALWRQLPIDDLHIAGLLSLTRQQVVNLRKSARDRLLRRMGASR